MAANVEAANVEEEVGQQIRAVKVHGNIGSRPPSLPQTVSLEANKARCCRHSGAALAGYMLTAAF